MLFVSFQKPIIKPPKSHHHKITLNLSSFIVPSVHTKKSHTTIQKQQPLIKKQPIVSKKHQHKTIKLPPKKYKTISKRKHKVLIETNNTKTIKHRYTKKIIKKSKLVKKSTKHKQKKYTKKRYAHSKVKHHTRKNRHKKNSLANTLSSKMKPIHKTHTIGGFNMKTIHKLYGKEYGRFSSKQKEFIRTNLGFIHRITQKVLIQNGYPRVSIRTHQQGTNIVSFYLHPNGDISHLRLKKRIGYSALDNNTLEVIKIAYKDYPLPAQKTKIVFYVNYSIY